MITESGFCFGKMNETETKLKGFSASRFFSSVSISVASPFDAFTIVYIGMGLMFVAGKPRTFMRKIRGGKWILL